MSRLPRYHADLRRLAASQLLLWLAILLPRPAAAAAPEAISEDDLCKTHITVDESFIPYCRNERLGEPRDSIRRAVVLIHGKLRNARTYYRTVEDIAQRSGGLQDTLLFALQFLTLADVQKHKLPKHFLYWSKEGWKDGHRSQNGPELSSFDVLDRVVKRLIEQNPNLETIVIAGHSAGAQFAQRHALGRKVETSSWKGELKYVIANPGSYMYLVPERTGSFDRCKETYNDYRYGHEDNRVEYFRATSPDSLWKRFGSAQVTIFLGNRDTDPSDTDQSCEARAQGQSRYERGLQFFNLTQRSWPSHVSGKGAFQLQIAPGIAHEFAKMWDSRCGRFLLLGRSSCHRQPPPAASFPVPEGTALEPSD